ncbi:MAG: tRNA (cytidine(34)-2'-O)-methyltransferase [Proteobacteria bacterium]|nr:tRNA (cytidine(34)-2'-O)-methyltransferase [Pseudomonadota bacterium]MBU1714058.1 tRNA (cytidine(34)-2'-O)-methyltransferase [Pseudomonadota bacterium]
MPQAPFNIVLVEPEIPPNTGSIARLCGATDSVLHLVKPLGFSTDDRYLKRAGLDYWKFVKIIYWESFDEFLTRHQDKRNKLFFLSKKIDRSYTACNFTPGDFLIFGKETKGLPKHILDDYQDQCYNIPMCNPNIRSLNLAMACGIVLYEALRQQQVK